MTIKQLQYCIFNERLQTMIRRGRKTGLKHICKAFFEARVSKNKNKKNPHSMHGFKECHDRRENLEYHYFSPKINISKLERSKIIATRKKNKETQELQITN